MVRPPPRHYSQVNLGITINSDPSCDQLIHIIVSYRFGSVLAFLFMSSFPETYKKHYVPDFITYIRPVLEYNSITLIRRYIHLIDLIENVQRQFTKRIYLKNCHDTSLLYTERFALLAYRTSRIMQT